jgi:ADP-heptose:LPS heptosyltransferase
MQLSAFIITKNEAADIAGCLQSLRGLAQDIVVVDSGSTDDTVAICQRLGARVFNRPFDGFGAQKQFALDQTTGDWAFSIDADEQVSPGLAEEIRAVMQSSPRENGFEVRRNFYFLGKRLRYGGVGSDWVLRLFRRDKGRFRAVRVHEGVEVSGAVGRLRNPLEHYSYPTLGEYLDKREHYTTLAAEEFQKRGKRFSWMDSLRPVWELFVRVVIKGAWLDGRAGLQYAKLSAESPWLRALKLRHLEAGAPVRPSKRILIVRTDRIGDVLLTTPLSRRLRERFPEAHIAWLVRSYTAPLLQQNPDVDEVLVDRDESGNRLIQLLKAGNFDTAIIAYPRWRTAWAVWRAGIPLRIGPASKWYSVFFNRRVWQHRSEGKKHEADYNLDLLQPLGVPFQRTATRFELTSDERAWARTVLEGHRISFQKPVICLHPGSGGSSERWPLANFMELGDRLQEAGCDVIVTGGPGENYQNIMIDNMRRIPVFIAAGSVSLRQLAAIMSQVDLMVSNSTGPLHLAVALGLPTVSIYSPIPTCHPRRWGPYPSYVEMSSDHAVFTAPIEGESAGDMSAVSVNSVWDACQKKLKNRRGEKVAL